MASQVLSGTSNPSYTNNTGQNVRVVINYMAFGSVTGSVTFGAPPVTNGITLNWGGTSASVTDTGYSTPVNYPTAIGRNLATPNGITNMSITGTVSRGLPTELMLAPGQTFSAFCGAYNIVVIPEAG